MHPRKIRLAVGILALTLAYVSAALIGFEHAVVAEQVTLVWPPSGIALAALILGETVRLFRWSAVAIGFVGILIILWPRFTVLDAGAVADAALLGAIFSLAAAFCSAFASVFIRTMTKTESMGTIVLYFSLSASVLSLISLPLGWAMPTPTG